MAKINVLEKHIAELIAAGEVVERPSSVVKELTENAIDAGAGSVTVEIQSGGIRYIRVTDNGCGIDRADVPLAFLRHATSKIARQDDLNAIGTLGFRGEALASICAMARVELLTRTEDELAGTRYRIDGGDEQAIEDAGCPCGTTIMVRDLFYNTPARMKFLKKDVAEGNAVAGVMDKLALSHPEVAVRFIRDGRETLRTSGDGKLRSAVFAVYGREFTQGLVPVSYRLGAVTVEGFVSKPSAARANRGMQNFFINGRFVKSQTASAAVEQACRGAVMVGKFPACVLQLHIPPEAVDVNVHPAKIEVRFISERPIFDAVYRAICDALSRGDTPKELVMHAGVASASRMSGPAGVSAVTAENRVGAANPAERADHIPVAAGAAGSDGAAVHRYALTPAADAPSAALHDGTEDDFLIETPVLRPFSAAAANAAAAAETRAVAGMGGACVPPAAVAEDLSAEIISARPQSADAGFASAIEATEKHDSANLTANTTTHAKENAAADTATVTIANTPPGDSGCTAAPTAEPPQPSFSVREWIGDQQSLLPDGGKKPLRFAGELFSTYILLEAPDEVIFIDKHAAHERILYEKLKKTSVERFAQQLLTPVLLRPSKEEAAVLLENANLLCTAGFEIAEFGSGTLVVRSAPMSFAEQDVEASLTEIAGHLLAHRTEVTTAHDDWILHNIACRAAIKAGDDSNPAELLALAQQLYERPELRYCPHGRPIYLSMKRRELEKQFGRIQ